MNPNFTSPQTPAEVAGFVRDRLPQNGLFLGQQWRLAVEPFPLSPQTARELEFLGRVLLKFYQAIDLLYRQSVAGQQPAWIAGYLDRGKPDQLLRQQHAPGFKNQIPRVIRPDILLADDHMVISELDSVPGGIGLTGWLNQTYAAIPTNDPTSHLIGDHAAMIQGFARIFGDAPRVHIVVSDEAAVYRPEMHWLADELNRDQPGRFAVRDGSFDGVADGDAIYRFFELFDLANIPGSADWFHRAAEGKLRLTPPPKPIFEEKLLFALLWNRRLESFWHRALGESFFLHLRKRVPYTWAVDPAPLPPHGALPELNLTDWHQLKTLSQRQRDLILKVSGYSEKAWGARGVYLGSDLSVADWSAAVDTALASFDRSPYVLQRYHKPGLVDSAWYNFDEQRLVPLQGRVRLCPYYFVTGDGSEARATLSGVLATICPAEKKIIHGMSDAILAPCAIAEQGW